MIRSYTARYTKIDSGYLGQLVEWPEVVTEGSGVEECRAMLRDALREMTLAYQQQGKEAPIGNDLFEPLAIDLEHSPKLPRHGSREKFESALASLPDAEPDEYDRL
jgi:predicted RNase H-like HicB family nuclease